MEYFDFISKIMIPAMGAASLGAVVGWLTRAFIWRFEKFNVQVLSGLIGIISGGALTGSSLYLLEADTRMFFTYFIGLSAEVQNTLRHRRFARINMGHHADISQ